MAKKKDVLDVLSPEQAATVLDRLAASDPEIRKKAREIALELVGDVDVEELAEAVYWELDSIAVEDVWDNSGPTRDGYVDPGDYAWQLFEEALEPFVEQLGKCQQLGLTDLAKLHCMGILQGIHRFEAESESEYKDWATDAPGEYFVSVFDDWRKGTKSKKDIAEVKRFVQELCPARAKLCK
jgi:hypothetical protein